MKYLFYNLPFNYESDDRFYVSNGGKISDNLPLFLYKKDENDVNKPYIKFISKLLINIKFKTEPGHFNYLIIEDNDGLQKGYFVIGNNKLISKNNFTFNLKLDIIMSYDLFKKPINNVVIDLTRFIYSVWKIDETDTAKIVLNDNKNYKIWNNNEFNNLILTEKKVCKEIVYKQKVIDWMTIQYTGGTSYPKQISNLLLVNLMKKLFKFNVKNDPSFFEIAIVSNGVNLDYLPIIELSDELKIFLIRTKDENNDITKFKKFLTEENFDFSNIINFVIETLFRGFVLLRDLKNKRENLIKNPNLQSVIVVSNIFKPLGRDYKKPSDLTDYNNFPTFRNFLNDVVVNDPSGAAYYVFKNDAWNINYDNKLRNDYKKWNIFETAQIKKLDINNELFLTKKNECNQSIFSNNYLNHFLVIFGDKIKLDNRLMFKFNNMFVRNQIYSTSEIIDFYQGENLDNINLNKLLNYSLEIALAYNKDVGAINYLVKSQYYNSRLRAEELSKLSSNKFITAQTDFKIAQNNSNISNVNNLLIRQSKLQIKYNNENTSLGHLTAGISAVGAAGAFLAGGKLAGGIGSAVKGASVFQGINTALNAFNAGERNVIQNRFIQGQTSARLSANNKNRAIINSALNDNLIATKKKIASDYNGRKGMILGEISDLLAYPVQHISSNVALKLYQAKQNAFTMQTEKPDIQALELMQIFFNKYGNEKFGIYEISTADWFKKNTFWDYFQGGNWEKYLYNIGIYDIDIINEFNFLMETGIRLIHNKYTKFRDTKAIINTKFNIDYKVANWPEFIGKKVLE